MAQHFSFRIPWHDNGWNGTICKNPSENYACMRLKGINQERDEELESKCAKCRLNEIEQKQDIPCIREGATFMSADDIALTITHPFSSWSENHKHLLPTKEVIPAYAYPARPFKWLMRERFVGAGKWDRIENWALEKGVDYHPEYEPQMEHKTWVQDGRNQKAVFDAFFVDTKIDESLCVFYAKQVPFVEDARRVVIGIGHVKGVEAPIKHNSSDESGMISYAWENMVRHSIRADMKDGFLLPYKELMKYAEDHESFDISQATVFAADDYFEEFSYAAEHLSHDAVIDVILQCISALEVVKNCNIPGDWNGCIKWLNDQLISVWEDRGAFPGFGPMLTSIGVASGPVVAKELRNRCGEKDSIWTLFEKTLDKPKDYLSPLCAKQITSVVKSTWNGLSKDRKTLFHLLSRIAISCDQAKLLFTSEQREKIGIHIEDRDIIENPYLIYEQTRDKAEQYKISIKKVDLAFYPPQFIADNFPIPSPSAMDSDVDKRRVRALAVSVLEGAALEGNTLMPAKSLIYAIENMNIKPTCPITSDMISGMNDFFKAEIEVKKDAFDKDYYKLDRYKRIDHLISTNLNKRIKSPLRHNINVDWRARVDEVCNSFSSNPNKEIEEKARTEKAAALKTLAEARLSVLIGGAGTGKTTVLEILCKEPAIQDGGILLLAPTGKARVRMSSGLGGKVRFTAQTIAQFLISNGRYDSETCTYKTLSPAERQKVKGISVPKTVIVDEASMITEDMFGALIDAISSEAERIILIGDYNQLPPIGAGRPFVDLVRYIRTVDKIGTFPMIGNNFAKLTITNRQLPNAVTNKIRSDVRLSKWFTDEDGSLDEDIFLDMQSGNTDDHLVFKQWSSKEELDKLLCEQIAVAANMKDADDVDGFSKSFGGRKHTSGVTLYNISKDGGKCAELAEKWQIIAPVKNDTHGILHMNHMIHEKYRRESIELAESGKYSRISKKVGAEGIVYGDKVINIVNKQRKCSPGNDGYVANGEIGVICGPAQKQTFTVEFSSQIGKVFEYTPRDFTDDSDTLELAYALTVHKSQGSQFEAVIVVLSDKCFLQSKELLYTALTRQKDKLIILYDAEAYNLKKYSSMQYSEIARRYTDLFEAPKIVEVNEKFYEENLIHKTKNGIMVRSKSEVIIANMLYDSGYENFLYEEKLPLGDSFKLPDFTIRDAASGLFVIWEHLGMLGDEEYRKAWEAKKQVYEANGFSEKNGNLIVTMDSLDGGIDCQEIQRKIDEYLG